jgi:hypothetical protein
MEDQLLFGCAPGHDLNVVEEQKQNLSIATTPHGELRCADGQTRVWLRAGYGYGPYGTGASTEMGGCHETAVYSHNIPAALVATAPGEYEDQKKDVSAAGLKGLFALGGKKGHEDGISSEAWDMEKLHKDSYNTSDHRERSMSPAAVARNFVPTDAEESDDYSEYVVPAGEIMNMGVDIKDVEEYAVSW